MEVFGLVQMEAGTPALTPAQMEGVTRVPVELLLLKADVIHFDNS